MEFPLPWSSPAVESKQWQVEHCQTRAAPRPCGQAAAGTERKTEPLEVECYNTTMPPEVAVKEEPSDSGTEAGNDEVTKARSETEASGVGVEGSDVKTEPSESISTTQHKEDLNDDFWDDIPVFYDNTAIKRRRRARTDSSDDITGLDTNVCEEERRKQLLAARRKKRAEARRISRAKLKQESPDLYQEQLKTNAEATRRKRMERRKKTLSSEQAPQDESKPSGKVKRKRADETPEERAARLKAQAEAARIKRQNETPEQRAARNRASAEARRKRYMKETPEQRQERLFFQAMKARKIRQRKTFQLHSPMSGDDTLLTDESSDSKTDSKMEHRNLVEKWEAQLKSPADAARLKQQNETPEQAEARRRAQAETKRIKRQNETPEQREARLLHQVSRQRNAKQMKTLQSDGSYSQNASSNANPKDGKGISAVKTLVKPAKSFVCEECGAAFDNSKSLTTHTYIHTGHCPPDRTFACRFCGAGFSDSLTLNDHLQDNHRGVCPFLCEVCGRAFYHNESLKVHLRRHSGQRPYTCHVCAASFTSAGSLQNHVRIHTGERPYSCSVCQATFRHNCALTGHMRSHTNERPYSCPDCESTFKHLGKLLAHRKRNHSRGPSTPQPGRRPILRVFEDPLF